MQALFFEVLNFDSFKKMNQQELKPTSQFHPQELCINKSRRHIDTGDAGWDERPHAAKSVTKR